MTQATTADRAPAASSMSVFERFLTVWVLLCIVAGIALGQFAPGVFQAIGRMEVAQVNLPVGLLIWVMVIPMLLKVDFSALGQVGQHWRGIGVTLFVNWAVKPRAAVPVHHRFAPAAPARRLDGGDPVALHQHRRRRCQRQRRRVEDAHIVDPERARRPVCQLLLIGGEALRVPLGDHGAQPRVLALIALADGDEFRRRIGDEALVAELTAERETLRRFDLSLSRAASASGGPACGHWPVPCRHS